MENNNLISKRINTETKRAIICRQKCLLDEKM